MRAAVCMSRVHARVSPCVCLHAPVCTCMDTAHTCVCAFLHECVDRHTCPHICMHTRASVCMYVRARVRVCICLCTHACAGVCMLCLCVLKHMCEELWPAGSPGPGPRPFCSKQGPYSTHTCPVGCSPLPLFPLGQQTGTGGGQGVRRDAGMRGLLAGRGGDRTWTRLSGGPRTQVACLLPIKTCVDSVSNI